VRAYLLCQFVNKNIVDPVAMDWTRRVVANGGPSPSVGTQTAMSTFVLCLRAAGLEAQMIAVNCFAPDSIVAAQTPLYVGGGSDPWVLSAPATPANLDKNGWHTPDGLGGFIFFKTGIIPSAVPSLSANNGGLTLYTTVLANGASSTASPMGCDDFGSKFMNLDIGTTAGATYASALNQNSGFASTAKVTIALPTVPGYYSANRISNTQNDLYFATSTSPHASIATSVAANPNGPCTQQVAVGTMNNGNVFATPGTHVFSFAAIHNGLTAVQSAALFACVQALRQFFGGGFL